MTFVACLQKPCARRSGFPYASLVSRMIRRRLSTTDGSQDKSELFKYTSGRWIMNEQLRLSERRLVFNEKALKSIIAQSVNRPLADIVSLEKMAEGGFNRIVQANFQDGMQVLARLPYPMLAPKHYAVSSEAATLEFLHSIGIPVPKVLGYSATDANPLGSEYLLLEKLDGVSLGNIWYIMDNKARKKVNTQVVDIEEKLLRNPLPASGSIYHPKDLRVGDEHVPIKHTPWVVGPTAQYEWHYKERTHLRGHVGPWKTFLECFEAPARRELEWCNLYGKPRLHVERHLRELAQFQKLHPQDYTQALHDFLKLAPSLDVPDGHAWSRPVLRHPDFSPSNIIVGDDYEIIGLVDWQHARVLPLCLAAGIPEHFQNWGDEASENMHKPATTLPDNYNNLSPQEKNEVVELLRRRLVHFLYAAKTMVRIPEHYEALRNPRAVLRARLYEHATWPWEGNTVTLKHDLAMAVESWYSSTGNDETDSTQFREPCPLNYSPEYIQSSKRSFDEQNKKSEEVGEMRAAMDIDPQGWVEDDEHCQTSQEMAKAIKASLLEDCQTDADRTAILEHFPFDDHDED